MKARVVAGAIALLVFAAYLVVAASDHRPAPVIMGR